MKATVYKTRGYFNLLSNDKEWQVVLRLYGDDGQQKQAFSEMWPADEEPDIANLLPSEVLHLIEARADNYLFSSKREKLKANIASVRDEMPGYDNAWALAKAEELEAGARRWRARINENRLEETPA